MIIKIMYVIKMYEVDTNVKLIFYFNYLKSKLKYKLIQGI